MARPRECYPKCLQASCCFRKVHKNAIDYSSQSDSKRRCVEVTLSVTRHDAAIRASQRVQTRESSAISLHASESRAIRLTDDRRSSKWHARLVLCMRWVCGTGVRHRYTLIATQVWRGVLVSAPLEFCVRYLCAIPTGQHHLIFFIFLDLQHENVWTSLGNLGCRVHALRERRLPATGISRAAEKTCTGRCIATVCAIADSFSNSDIGLSVHCRNQFCI
jgi:hypothetical protein